MNAQLLCLVAVLSADPSPQQNTWQTAYQPSAALAAAFRGETPSASPIIRGQSLSYDEEPTAAAGQYDGSAQTYASPPPGYSNGGPYLPPQSPQWMTDPFLGQGVVPGAPFPGPTPGGYLYGVNGPQPYRFGWTIRGDVGYLPEESTSNDGGKFGVFEFNSDFRYTIPWQSGWIFTSAPQFSMRSWDGPNQVALPGSVYRVGWDLQLATPQTGPWSIQLDFNPSINTDFDSGVGADAWNFDGYGILFYQASPQWLWAFGAGFWDRVNDRVIPYAGVVWRPDDIWEWRLVFPNPRVSLFLGNTWWGATWFYVSGEYHIEAYQIEIGNTNARERIEIQDWRVMVGLRSDNGRVASFLEAGWLLDRSVEFGRTTPDFSIDDGFMARFGLRF